MKKSNKTVAEWSVDILLDRGQKIRSLIRENVLASQFFPVFCLRYTVRTYYLRHET